MQRFEFEWRILDWLNNYSNNFLTTFFQIITILGGELILIGIVGFIYYCIDKEKGEQIAFVALTAVLLNNALKSVINAKRPLEYEGKEYLQKLPTDTVSATGSSFPSGHSQNTATLYTISSLYLKKKWFTIVSILLIILVPISRLYLAVHFPTDVIIGTIIGLITAFGLYFLINYFKKKEINKFNLYFFILIIFLPFLFFNKTADLFKGYGLFLGFVLGILIENNYINFSMDVPIWKKALRIIIGAVIILSIKEGLKLIFPKSLMMDTIRYSLISLSSIGLFPFFFKSNRFKRGL